MPASSTPKPAVGDCFVAAGKFISSKSVVDFPRDYRLVHGNLASLRQDVAVNHAWVEEDDLVHEVSNGQKKVFPKDAYYGAHGVTTVRRYTSEEALVLMLRHEHESRAAPACATSLAC
jgi:hypothetical protein